ncbi:hydrogenase expression/formation C-terminal domain-containing protein [Candidatus Contendibacter odensensis]|uniref:HupH hydrogenase expression protein C-terminal domain-containing protein n=1 Tax=Candidatus Contendobacter odensis Run_B_J11 TaxID=1400861 RepID=A0A7U7G9L3_9GAMM|nr:hydrogenase expression/formation C-terminal domain-containing protein [Candidatus Contendobacter odensis]CDH44462.1 hypothetical protein BN874_1680038 [Candidatus Contendobacter odensis Run_B_J11]
MPHLSDIPVCVDLNDNKESNLAIAKTVLNEIRALIAQLINSGKTGAIDLRQRPRMRAETYQYLKDALSSGEVTAVVDAAVKVEVRETRYPGVWWLTHLNEQGAIVTEIIEITEIPEILKPHIADMRAGLKRFDQILADFTSHEESPTTLN